jgi:hypothetical protein
VAYELRFPSFGVTSRRHGLQNGAHMSPKRQAYLEFVQGRDPRLGGLPICPYAKGGKYFIAEAIHPPRTPEPVLFLSWAEPTWKAAKALERTRYFDQWTEEHLTKGFPGL